jgi:hypothetical protein
MSRAIGRQSQSSIFCYQIRESEKHLKGKNRLYDLFKKNGYSVFKEVPSQERLEDGQIKNYIIDVLCCGRIINSHDPIYIILEVDGRKGHRTGITDKKAELRDSHFLNKYAIPTVRFAFEDLQGVDKITDDLIIKEVEYWIKVNYDKVITQNKLIYSKKAKCCKCGDFSNVHTFSGCMVCECQWGFIHELQ